MLFLAKFVEIDVTEVGTQKTKFAHVARTDEVRVPPMTIFLLFFYFLVCKASSILSHSHFPRNPAKLRYESAKYRDYLFFCADPGHACGRTNHRTTIVHAFLKSAIDLDGHPGKHFVVIGQNRRN